MTKPMDIFRLIPPRFLHWYFIESKIPPYTHEKFRQEAGETILGHIRKFDLVALSVDWERREYPGGSLATVHFRAIKRMDADKLALPKAELDAARKECESRLDS